MDHALCFAALAAFAGALHAEGCAGGFGRGMDITGNECNDTVPDADAVVVPRAPVTASRVTGRARPDDGGASALAKNVAISRGSTAAQTKVARVAGMATVDIHRRVFPPLADLRR
jgi:hypothetical protein